MVILIKTPTDTFSRSPRGSIRGNIWIQIDDFDFPAERWDDFPVIILGWWLETFIALLSKTQKSGNCLFMDGPFGFKVDADEEEWKLRFIRRGREREECTLEIQTDPRYLAAQTASAANSVIRVCHERKWLSGDLDVLATRYTLLSKLTSGKN